MRLADRTERMKQQEKNRQALRGTPGPRLELPVPPHSAALGPVAQKR